MVVSEGIKAVLRKGNSKTELISTSLYYIKQKIILKIFCMKNYIIIMKNIKNIRTQN